jgi:hypothetical protein
LKTVQIAFNRDPGWTCDARNATWITATSGEKVVVGLIGSWLAEKPRASVAEIGLRVGRDGVLGAEAGGNETHVLPFPVS